MRPKWTSQQIEIALYDHFNPRLNLCVPNVSWGLFKYHEADLVVLTKSNWGTEVEIKVSSADIKKDLLKKHKHKEAIIKDLWFAVPEGLETDVNIPKDAGIIVVKRYIRKGKTKYHCQRFRMPVSNKKARKFSDEERLKLLRLGCLRLQGLKQKLNDKQTLIDELKTKIRELENV